jgi:hypothetical protein
MTATQQQQLKADREETNHKTRSVHEYEMEQHQTQRPPVVPNTKCKASHYRPCTSDKLFTPEEPKAMFTLQIFLSILPNAHMQHNMFKKIREMTGAILYNHTIIPVNI